VETRAANGRNAYVDRDSPFSDLPPMLVGADWVQAAARDASYSAVDLIELTPAAGSVVTVAWDAALPPPRWLGERFDRTSTRLVVNGRAMTLFTRLAPAGESLTLGGNTDAAPPPAEANMYLVFVHAPTH
jgi:hypothetical protein